MSFDKPISHCDEQQAQGLFAATFDAYLQLIERGENTMAKLITLLTTVSVVAVAAAPAFYAYAALA